MTIVGILWTFFPASLGAAAVACLAWLVVARDPWALLALLAVLYLVPPLLHRWHQWLWPVKRGGSKLADLRYNPWWGSYQLQLLYIGVPVLEASLRLVPGLYSAWLRLWGSRIGRRVVWTPVLDVTDRGLLDIGDDVIMGHSVHLFSHVIRPMKDNLLLYVKPVTIGAGAFVGAGSAIGPGAHIGPRAVLPAASQVMPNEERVQ